jgi:uncharacterized protein (TIGR02646 family)
VIFVNRSRVKVPEVFSSIDFLELSEDLSLFHAKRSKQTHSRFDQSVWLSCRKSLDRLFNKRCAYCESIISSTLTGLIDHFRPINSAINLDGKQNAGYWWLAYQWSNLYLICDECNRLKKNRFPVKGKRFNSKEQNLNNEKYLLIDPCNKDDIDESEFLFDEDGKMESRSDRGTLTIEVLGLNRSILVSRRKMLIETMRSSFLLLNKSNINNFRKLVSELKDPSFGYCAMQRFLLSKWESVFIDSMKGSNNFFTAFELSQLMERKTSKIGKSESISYGLNSATKEEYYKSSKIINRIEIKNFKSIKELNIDFPKPHGNYESWLVIIGENGVGKSSILQAISLALCGDEYLKKLKIPLKKLIRTSQGVNKATVKVFMNDSNDPIILTITSKEISVIPSEPQILVLGYGPTRLLSNEEQQGMKAQFESNIRNLFDQYNPLKNVENWLADPSVVSSKDFNLISSSVRDILLLPNILDNSKELLFIRRSGRITLNINGNPERIYDLCDGYKSVIAYVLDIIMSIYKLWPSVQDAEGLVLIDEIETHLHPTWKIQIITLLRKVFPLLNFVVTTHDPLCLRGAKSGEVNVLSTSNTGDVIMENIDIPLGMPIEDLLLGVWFKMDSTMDESTNELLNRHRSLVLNKKENLQEVREIENDLSKRMVFSHGKGVFNNYLNTLDKVLEESQTDLTEEQISSKIEEKLKNKLGC